MLNAGDEKYQMGNAEEHEEVTLDPVVLRVEILRIIVECHVQLQQGQWKLRDSIAKVHGRLKTVDERIKHLQSTPEAAGVQTVQREYEELRKLVKEEHMQALERLRKGHQLLDGMVQRLGSIGEGESYALLQMLERELSTWLRQ